ncbi:ATP-binding cassette sub-family A member 1 [Orussus abietinus]|uniref:ATP-binding cassette sub-family A member 1 n=1 Tax=Orussus abietinus TaxID=222816 RepID=UPI0006269328|nr:ATP-binding cassette sub-family A member 1 [Orussus abietinus]XP_012272936.1 ATP-binding cassette sub-family A member 1 [Orussus abietinus]XP_012272937.1 ATP-binding cassette sub-family A member 1 [Orussus abietinus]XP_012272938.1 ATP-binding cassette sub-family A member 1 [Orussus abietinus]XP_012272939.1 ATP-binding cassette sub-family A member 1 [Orussus abietinus]XP_012272941.1 ATP-binding cassette sub-family A member 1 [Orussus abietinus]
MACHWGTYKLLLYKNYITRFKHWVLTAFEVISPIFLFLVIIAARDVIAKPPIHVGNNTYFPIYTKTEMIASLDKHLTHIYYFPKNVITSKIMDDTRKCLLFPANQIIGFDSESDLLNANAKQSLEDRLSNILAVYFEDIPHSNNTLKKLKYTIRTSSRESKELFYNYVDDYYLASMAFIDQPFAQTQICIDESFMNSVSQPSRKTEISIQQMPYPPYDKIDRGDAILRTTVCTIATIAFLCFFTLEPYFVGAEKSTGINVLMAMNGVQMYQNLFCWLLSSIPIIILTITPITVLFTVPFTDNHSFIYYGNSFIFWLVLLFHSIHLMSLGYHISSFFSKPLYMESATVIVYMAMMFLHRLMLERHHETLALYLGIIFPNALIHTTIENINAYESKLIGINWRNLFTPGLSSYGTGGSIGCIIIFSILGSIIHLALALYVHALFPGKYGVPKHPLFFLKWVKKNKVSGDDEMIDLNYIHDDQKHFEPVQQGSLIPGIQIRNVTKKYSSIFHPSVKVQALKGVSLDFYKGQISALLGHNGAGKTTLMSILTGMTDPTSGTIYVNGENLKTDLNEVLGNMGLCPQEDIVFPDLTVYQQLKFFGLLKNNYTDGAKLDEMITYYLRKLNLYDKKNSMPITLSGGQKRKLCLAMAFITDASVLILDEPTSGMDPENRRDVWDIILRTRGEKTIIITTHSMEEADVLGDRIAILQMGQLKSYGTSMFLKKQYGHGYLEISLSIETWCDPSKITTFFGPNVETRSFDSRKMMLSVPFNDSLPETLDQLESRKKEFGITGISVSVITLEEVFLEITKEEEDTTDTKEPLIASSERVSGWQLLSQATFALVEKKYLYHRKNQGLFWLTVLLPLVHVLLLLLGQADDDNIFPVQRLALDVYNSPYALIFTDDASVGEKYKNLIEMSNGKAQYIQPGISLTEGLLMKGRDDIETYQRNFITSAEFNVTENTLYANAFYSGTAVLSMPIAVNLLTNALLKAQAGDEYSIDVSRQRLPNMNELTNIDPVMISVLAFQNAFSFVFFLFISTALFVIHLIKENASQMKQLQRMTGISAPTYWGITYICDIFVFLLSIMFLVIGIYLVDTMYDMRQYYCKEIGITVLLLVLYAICALPIIYIFSFLKNSVNTVLKLLYFVPLIAVFTDIIAAVTLTAVEGSSPWVKPIRIIIQHILPLIPHVSFTKGYVAFLAVSYANTRCRQMPSHFEDILCSHGDPCCALQCNDGVCQNYFPYNKTVDGIGNLKESILYLIFSSFLFIALLLIMEEKVIQKFFAAKRGYNLIASSQDMNEDVKEEKGVISAEINKRRKQINEITNTNNSLLDDENENVFLAYELSKTYGKTVAVKEVNFRVRRDECFGLLGVNGAGKSTTFKMLTGDEIPNSGIVMLGNADLRSRRVKYLSEMGYCPQTHALIPSFNAFDHLRLFARLRGVPRSELNSEVISWISRLNLSKCASQPSSTYSGGNKRRLSIAIAVIGSPKLVLLDEPTTGVDPTAKRAVWCVLRSCQASGQSIIITSHSMEECEALCGRLVIMVKGEIMCIGPIQELKQRLGAGFDIGIKLKLNRTNKDVDDIKTHIQEALPCDFRDENMGYLLYHVTDPKTTWKTMFEVMTGVKNRWHCVEDFSVLSSTLEELFIRIARNSKDSAVKDFV